jgi:hypothetical protein
MHMAMPEEARVGKHRGTNAANLHAVLCAQLPDEHGNIPLYRADPTSRYVSHGMSTNTLISLDLPLLLCLFSGGRVSHVTDVAAPITRAALARPAVGSAHGWTHTIASESNSERLRPLSRNEDRGSCGIMHSYAAGRHTGKENVALAVVGPPGGVQVQRRPPSQRRDANFRMHLHTRAVGANSYAPAAKRLAFEEAVVQDLAALLGVEESRVR